MEVVNAAVFEEHPADDAGSTVMDENYVVVAATHLAYIGANAMELTGYEESYGADVRHVMKTRRPLSVCRFWNGAVWESYISAHEAGGIQVDFKCVYKIPTSGIWTLTHFVDSARRVSEALSADFEGRASRSAVEVPVSASLRRLRSVPTS